MHIIKNCKTIYYRYRATAPGKKHSWETAFLQLTTNGTLAPSDILVRCSFWRLTFLTTCSHLASVTCLTVCLLMKWQLWVLRPATDRAQVLIIHTASKLAKLVNAAHAGVYINDVYTCKVKTQFCHWCIKRTLILTLATCHPNVHIYLRSVRELPRSDATKRKQSRCFGLTRAALVMFKSFITSSNAAVSSACFWLCKAIFSLNLRGLLEDAIFPSSSQWNVTSRATPGPSDVVITYGERPRCWFFFSCCQYLRGSV